MSHHFLQQMRSLTEHENKLILKEKSSQVYLELNPNAEKYFVADHLSFDCQEGVYVLPLIEGPYKSKVALHASDGTTFPFWGQDSLPRTNWTLTSRKIDSLSIGPPAAHYNERKFVGYAEFKQAHQNRNTLIYTLASHNPNPGTLYQINAETGQELQHYEFPFAVQSGNLSTADIKEGADWRTVLLVTLDTPEGRSVVLGFYITENSMTLEPILSIQKEKVSTHPKLIRFKNHFGFILGTEHNNEKVIEIIEFRGNALSSEKWQVQANPRFIVPVDSDASGTVDRIYFTDASALWKIDLKQPSPLPTKLQDIEVETLPKVVKDSRGTGLLVLFSGKNQDRKGIYVVRDTVHQGLSQDAMQMISVGDYFDILIRFGRLILIPKDHRERPKVINLPDYVEKTIEWTTQPAASIADSEIKKIVLRWDPKNQQEVLTTLNASLQLISVVSARINQDQYGRIAWSKLLIPDE